MCAGCTYVAPQAADLVHFNWRRSARIARAMSPTFAKNDTVSHPGYAILAAKAPRFRKTT
jgi:hypothetical protein